MKRQILFLVLSFVWTQLDAQVVVRPVVDSLLENAHAVTLFDESTLTVKRDDRAKFSRSYQLLIVNKFADDLTDIVLPFNSFSQVKNIRVRVLDLTGEEIQSFKSKDFQEVAGDWGSVASDSKMKYLDVNYDRYPFILDVSYDQVHKGTLHYPPWLPIQMEKQSVLKASFTVETEAEIGLNYHSQRIPEPEQNIVGDKLTYRWNIEGLKAVEAELFSNMNQVFPKLLIAPDQFEMNNYEGSMESWEHFGEWIVQLNEGRDQLPQEQIVFLQSLTADAPSIREKVKRVYQHLQDQTRYVSIQLGIGGWQPFEAAYVCDKKYGDCKALSFYMKSMLQVLDIPAYYTLIRAGGRAADIPEDFVHSGFNHAILTVPIDQDTIWLECTSKTSPFGYLGSFTSNRNALLVDVGKSRLIRTKAYTMEDNLQSTHGMVKLKSDGTARATLNRRYTCLEMENMGFEAILNQSEAEQRKWLVDRMDWGRVEIQDLKILPMTGDLTPYTGFETSFYMHKASRVSGKRLLIDPTRFNVYSFPKLPKSDRSQDIFIRNPYTHVDSIMYIIPEGYELENNHEDIFLETPFGQYEKQLVLKPDGTLWYHRVLKLNSGTYPASSYEDFRTFAKTIRKNDRKKIVLVRSEG